MIKLRKVKNTQKRRMKEEKRKECHISLQDKKEGTACVKIRGSNSIHSLTPYTAQCRVKVLSTFVQYVQTKV